MANEFKPITVRIIESVHSKCCGIYIPQQYQIFSARC